MRRKIAVFHSESAGFGQSASRKSTQTECRLRWGKVPSSRPPSIAVGMEVTLTDDSIFVLSPGEWEPPVMVASDKDGRAA